MADPKLIISAADISKWAERLAADDWSWLTWKYLLGDAALILLWLAFLTTLILMLIPKSRKRLAVSARIYVNGGTIFSAFCITWIVGIFGQGAMFGPGPYGYWLHHLLGTDLFALISDWTFRYMTLMGLLVS